MERLLAYFKPKNYNLTLNINKKTRKCYATTIITGTPVKPQVKFHAKNLSITSVTVDGNKADFSIEEDVVVIALEAILRQREQGVGSVPVTTGDATGASGAMLPHSPLRLVAIGEVALDYHNDASRIAQQKLFERMLQLALDHDLPLIFHVREAFDDFFAMLDNFPSARGVVHSFSDNRENLIKSLDHGFYIGVNGLSTFAPELPIADIPLDRILLETDAPFLTPAPFRGTINEPARIREICAHVSKLKGESEADIARITTKNAEQLFHI